MTDAKAPAAERVHQKRQGYRKFRRKRLHVGFSVTVKVKMVRLSHIFDDASTMGEM